MITTDGYKICIGNIVDDEVLTLGDVIVNPTNPMMRFGCGVSGAIFQKAGVETLEKYTEKTFGISYEDTTRKNEMAVTDVRITPGFNIACDILFAQGPKAYEYDDIDKALELLEKTYCNIFELCNKQGYKKVLLPALGTGDYCFTHEQTAPVFKRAAKKYGTSGLDIILVLYDNDAVHYYLQKGD